MCKTFVTDSGFLTKTLVRPIWYWSLSMLTDRRRWRTPCCSGPLQHGHVSAVRMAYLDTTSVHTPTKINFESEFELCSSFRTNTQKRMHPFQEGLNSPHQKLIEDSAVRKSSPSYAYVFPQSQVFNLMPSPKKQMEYHHSLGSVYYMFECMCLSEWGRWPALLPVFRSFCLIGFDTADIVRRAFHQRVHQIISLPLSETPVRQSMHCYNPKNIFPISCILKLRNEGYVGRRISSFKLLSVLTLTLIFELAVVGLPFLSVLRFSGNKLRMKPL